MSIDYAIIVKNKTRLESLIERFNTKSQAKFYIERQGGNFEDYELEHNNFQSSLNLIQILLSKIIKNKTIERDYLPSYIFSKRNIIIVVGQDGLVANVAKYSNGIPIIAINPDKARYDGVLLPFDTSNFIAGVDKVLLGKFSSRKIRFAEASLNNGQKLLAFNDLFIGASSHISARYKISFNKKIEEQSSSGLIVSTQAGSTGWLSSIFNMAYGVANMFEKDLKIKRPKVKSNQLLFAIREPFQSIKTQIGITTGIINKQNILTIESLMPANGIIFSDGIETDRLNFNSGAIAEIRLADKNALLVINQKNETS
jgi:NAD kinase